MKTTITAAVHDDSLQDQAFDDDNDDSFEDKPMGAAIYALMVNSISDMVFDSNHSIYTLVINPSSDTINSIDPSSPVGAIIPAFTIGELTSNAYSFAFDSNPTIATNDIVHASITSLLNKDVIATKDGRKLIYGELTKNIHETLFEAILFIDKLTKQLEGWDFERIFNQTLTRFNIHGAPNWRRHGYII